LALSIPAPAPLLPWIGSSGRSGQNRWSSVGQLLWKVIYHIYYQCILSLLPPHFELVRTPSNHQTGKRSRTSRRVKDRQTCDLPRLDLPRLSVYQMYHHACFRLLYPRDTLHSPEVTPEWVAQRLQRHAAAWLWVPSPRQPASHTVTFYEWMNEF
jgi:hypothetical protein